MGSLEHPLITLYVEGSVSADGDSFRGDLQKNNASIDKFVGPGGGSGGTILLFLRNLDLRESGYLSSAGGHGSLTGGGGGGGGRIHFHWSDISTGDVYWPIATVNGTMHTMLVQMKLFHVKSFFCCSIYCFYCSLALNFAFIALLFGFIVSYIKCEGKYNVSVGGPSELFNSIRLSRSICNMLLFCSLTPY